MNKSHTWPCFSFNEGRHCELASVEMNEKNTNVHNSMVSCNSGGLSFTTLQFSSCPDKLANRKLVRNQQTIRLRQPLFIYELLEYTIHHVTLQSISRPDV